MQKYRFITSSCVNNDDNYDEFGLINSFYVLLVFNFEGKVDEKFCADR